MTMRERIVAGKLFTDYCEGLPEDRTNCKKRMIQFNSTMPDDVKTRMAALNELLGKETNAWVEPPFYCCYGTNITIGEGCYLNFNCNFVDDGKIIIGKKVMFGPAVTIATVGHPVNPKMREYMYTDPVKIEDNCWIGAGSVVVHDIPANSVAAGNPCKVIREIGEQDQIYYYKDRVIDEFDLEEERKLR